MRHVLGLADARHVHAPPLGPRAAQDRQGLLEHGGVDAVAQRGELLDGHAEAGDRFRRAGYPCLG